MDTNNPAYFEIYTLADRARTAIALGESQYREFKSALHGKTNAKTKRPLKEIGADIAETLVAFANADGGELLVGVEDSGSVTGMIGFDDADFEQLLDAPKTRIHNDTPLAAFKATRLDLDGETILYFSVLKGTDFVHLTSNGLCLQRRDNASVPISAEEIKFSRQEIMSRQYDREFVDGATADALNLSLMASVANDLMPGMTVERCLQHLDLVEFGLTGIKLRRAALLLFANQPSRWHPRLHVRIVTVNGTEILTGDDYNVITDQVVHGNLIDLLENAWEALRPHLVQTRLTEGARFKNTIIYPEQACREALVNAIAHRDYLQDGRGIEISVFTDRLEFRSPGPLLSNIRLDDLYLLEGVHQSRNSFVARVLRELGYMRELGEGVRRIFQLMKNSELAPPDLRSTGDAFSITLHYKAVYSRDEQLFLDNFAAIPLNREQKAIVALGRSGKLISPQEIWDFLGIVDTEHYRRLVKSLQDLNVLITAVPKTTAANKASKQHIPVRQVPRFKIQTPHEAASKFRTTPTRARNSDDDDDALRATEPEARLYVSNLPQHLRRRELERALLDVFSKFGQVASVTAPTWGKRNKGYAFIAMLDARGAEQAKSAKLVELDGFALVVRDAIPRSF